MVSVKRIEANPDKIKAIMNMMPPTNKREVQKLTGRIAALNRFISKDSSLRPQKEVYHSSKCSVATQTSSGV